MVVMTKKNVFCKMILNKSYKSTESFSFMCLCKKSYLGSHLAAGQKAPSRLPGIGLKKVLVKTMFSLTVFEILQLEGRLV